MIGGSKYRYAVTAALACAAVPTAAFAQQQIFQFDIKVRSLDSALRAFARTAHQQVIFSGLVVRGLRSPALTGSHTAEEALRILLAGSGLEARRGERGVWVINPGSPQTRADAPGSTERLTRNLKANTNEQAVEATATTPDILVTGKRDWTLNTGIKRSRDDSQPFTVFTREDIKKSGAVDIETFLRNQLTSNASAATGEQAGGLNVNRTSISLRGLNARDTLILVDGRRQAGISTGYGDIEQPSLTGIPLASIERIEVLASSASGLYGLGATGGVVNVVLRRDYVGGQISATYADTGDFKAPEARIDGTYAFNLEGGRTNVSLNGSYRKSNPLLYGERDLLQRGRQFAFANDSFFFEADPPLGATPNIASTDVNADYTAYVPLTLKPEYGGTALGSTLTFVPSGYRGIALDGPGPLIANAGKLNLNLSDDAGRQGGRSPIIVGSEQYSGSIAVRREMTDWLKLYAEGAYSRSTTYSPFNRAPIERVRLLATSPANPFQQNIVVEFPTVGADANNKSINENIRALGGAILTLPYEWQGGVDVSWNRSKFSNVGQPPGLTLDSLNALQDGRLNVLTDTASFPLTYQFLPGSFGSERTPSVTRILVTTAKFAGPIPLRLPAGRPTLSFNLERSRDVVEQARIVSNDYDLSYVQFTPERSQTIESVYAETRIPLISQTMHIPLVEELELQIAARYEHYQGRGSGILYTCFVQAGPFTSDDQVTGLACPPAGQTIAYATTSNSHTDPTFSMKWKVGRDLTFRASYARGYLPPQLSQLLKTETNYLTIAAFDPARNNEPIGIPYYSIISRISGFTGGNPDVKPESSKTFTAGAIVTPRFVPGLRFSVDWTHIEKKNNYFSPNGLLFGLTPQGRAAFEQFLALFPERFTRGAPSDGFAVGPITSIDASIINLAGSTAEALDFTADYSHDLWGGTLQVNANATRVLALRTQILSSLPSTDYLGSSSNNFSAGGSDFGSLKWKGNASISWSNTRFSIGASGRYFDGYFLYADHSVDPAQYSATVSSQAYFDVFGTFNATKTITLRAGINDVLDKKPPLVPSEGFYSRYGDPRNRNFYLQVTKAF